MILIQFVFPPTSISRFRPSRSLLAHLIESRVFEWTLAIREYVGYELSTDYRWWVTVQAIAPIQRWFLAIASESASGNVRKLLLGETTRHMLATNYYCWGAQWQFVIIRSPQ